MSRLDQQKQFLFDTLNIDEAEKGLIINFFDLTMRAGIEIGRQRGREEILSNFETIINKKAA